MPIGNLTPRDVLRQKYELLKSLRANVKSILKQIHDIITEMQADPNWNSISSANEKTYTNNFINVADTADSNIPIDPDGS